MTHTYRQTSARVHSCGQAISSAALANCPSSLEDWFFSSLRFTSWVVHTHTQIYHMYCTHIYALIHIHIVYPMHVYVHEGVCVCVYVCACCTVLYSDVCGGSARLP